MTRNERIERAVATPPTVTDGTMYFIEREALRRFCQALDVAGLLATDGDVKARAACVELSEQWGLKPQWPPVRICWEAGRICSAEAREREPKPRYMALHDRIYDTHLQLFCKAELGVAALNKESRDAK